MAALQLRPEHDRGVLVMTALDLHPSPRPAPRSSEPVALVDLLDRLLAAGVVVHGRVTLAVAEIDLVDVELALLVAAAAKLAER